MTKGDAEAVVAGPEFPQELGKSRSRRPGDGGQQQQQQQQQEGNVGDKTLNDVPSAQNSSEKSRKRRKKKKNKQQQSEEVTGESSAVPTNAPADIASMVAKAAAALEKRNESDQSPAVEDAQEQAVEPEKKKRRKKGHRQTSQEEESAQALLALNKSGLGGNGNDEQHEAGPSKKRKKRKAKKHLGEEQVMEEAFGNEAGVAGETVVQDAEMPNAEAEANPGKTGASSSTAPGAVEAVATGPENDLPDSERIITEHLAAHMAKITPAQTAIAGVSEDMLVEQRLMNELHHNGIRAPIMGSENFVSVNSNGGGESTTRPSPKTSSKKRKRSAENPSTTNSTLTQQGLLVDPQLMQLDEEAAMAASELPADESNSKQSKKRRRAAPATLIMGMAQEGEEDGGSATKKPAARRKTVTDVKGNWGSTASGSTEPSNGGTFTLEERFAIDRALQDYCKVHDMTMDELRDRVWGNNRRKDEFWDNICEAVPNRSRASVYKHVRRSCHIFQQRAKWTSEEDGQLAILVKEKGNKWKDIGLAMGRMGEDCRDRYRNYVKCGEDRGKDRWKEEEEELLKKAVAEHKEIARQVLLSEGKSLPSLEDEDNVLINWTTVSEKMENKRSRIQCRYKWKKMLAQKEKVKQAPLGVAYVGGKKKRLHFDIGNMLAGDKYWLLLQIRDSGATQENEIPWDQIAKNDKEVGIWNHKDLKNAYKKFREHIPYRRRPLHEIIKQLLSEMDAIPAETLKNRFIPSNAPISAGQEAGMGTLHIPPASHNSTSQPHATDPQSGSSADYEHQLFQMVQNTPHSGVVDGSSVLAPVASMGPGVQFAHHQGMMVDPELMGQGNIQELEKMAGAALQHAADPAAGIEAEDDSERELRKRLGGYIQQSDAVQQQQGNST